MKSEFSKLNFPKLVGMIPKKMYLLTLLLSTAAFSMPARVNPDTGSFLDIGSGYDLVSGNPAGNCIVPQEAKPVSKGIAEVTAQLTYIRDIHELAKSLEISSSTNVKLGMPGFKYSLSSTTKFFSSQKIEDESLYFMVEVEVKMPIEKISKVKLDEDSKKLLGEENGPERFRKACGDEFVDAIQRGGKFYGLVQIKTYSSEEKRKLELQISGKISVASANLSLAENLSEVVKNYKYQMFFTQVGGVIQDFPKNIDDFKGLITQAKNYAESISRDNTGMIIMSSTVPYEQAINFPKGVSSIRTADKINTVETYSNLKFSTLKVLQYIDSVLANPDEYEEVSIDNFVKLNDIRDQYLNNMNIINEFADNCFYNIKDCRVPSSHDGFMLAQYPKIKRKEKVGGSVTVNPYVTINKPEVECKKWQYKEGTGAVCGISDIKIGRGEVCGVEKYNTREDTICGTKTDFIVQEFDPGYRNCLPGRSNVDPDQNIISNYFPQSDWESCSSRGSQTTCQNRHSGHWWVLCRGEVPQTCERSTFGVKSYKECTHPSFGITYNSCRHQSFGNEACIQ